LVRRTVLFDLTRLLSATGRSAPTGIERVEFAYARWLANAPSIETHFVVTMNSRIRLAREKEVAGFLARQGATWQGGAQGFSETQAIDNVNAFLRRGSDAPHAPRFGYLPADERQRRKALRQVDPKQRKRLLTTWAQQMAAEWSGAPVDPILRRRGRKSPAIYLRASLDRMEHPGPIERLKRFDGVKMVTFCHDTIPLDFPEYVRPASAVQCGERVRTLAKYTDGVIVNSHYSAGQLKKHLGGYRPQIRVAHIGAEQDLPPLGANLPPLEAVPYFLVVSTIEARKNHTLLFNIWRRLAETMGDRAPKLIVAGKRGWEAQAPIAMLDRAGSLSDHVYEAGAVPDAALDVLRRNALAVLMPSFVEGFGMPVTEALAVDTPVIASDIPVFREIVGDAADLIDPTDGPSWQRAIVEFAQPGSARRAAAVERARAYVAPSWEQHFVDVHGFLEEITDTQTLADKARRMLSQVTFEAPFEGVPRVSH
jgi:glycosyltransferase involved in cell wall biosynthesis